MLSIVVLTEFFVRCLKVLFDVFGNSSPSAFHFETQVVHWTLLWTIAAYGFVFAERIIREGVLTTVLTVSARKLHLQRQVLQRDISGFQEKMFAGWATSDCLSAFVADVVATQTEGDGRHHVLLAGRTLQLFQDAFIHFRHRSLYAGCNEMVVHTLKEWRQLPETQQFVQYYPTALLPHSDTSLCLTHIRTTVFHSRSPASTACTSTLTHPLTIATPCEWIMIFFIQNLSLINTPII